MTYQINVNQSKIGDFLQIIQSLKNLGVIDSFESFGSLAREGEPISTEELMTVLKLSQKDAKEGRVVANDQVKKVIKNWTKK